MRSIRLKKSYQKQLVRAGVPPQRARQAAASLTVEQLKLISDIWPEWAIIYSNTKDENLQEHLLHEKAHQSVYSRAKRLVDLLGASVGLSFTAILVIPIAVMMLIDSPGPIFYSQMRCGLRGKPFRIWKFRSMVVGAELCRHRITNEVEGCIFKNRNDPRTTHIGKFLRKTSLDELPQFWNILKGEISLVGTRPPTPDEVKRYSKHHYKRLLVKPGLTGEWQVNGRSKIKSFEEVVRMDLDYQRKWSLLYDLQLILKTVSVVLTGKGAC